MLNPLNWFRLWSPRFGRSDMAQEYYDGMIFNGATLGDLVKGKGLWSSRWQQMQMTA
jgi:NTE family protein